MSNSPYPATLFTYLNRTVGVGHIVSEKMSLSLLSYFSGKRALSHLSHFAALRIDLGY